MFPLRFTFVARDRIHFPAGNPANILRGAFGHMLRRLACAPDCSGAAVCERRGLCSYARLFEPAAGAAHPSGLADWPRPFVFRAAHLDGRTVEPGESFHFGLNLFEMSDEVRPELAHVFAELMREGLGPSRGRADLTGMSSADGDPLVLTLAAAAEKVEQVQVRFVTATELKGSDGLLERPDFDVLAARIRDRISTLRTLYQGGPLEMDFRAFGERASRVRTMRCELTRAEAVRRSSRTGQVHSLGGFVGIAEYAGELAEFLPFLRAAAFTGVGRQTVWGKGELEVTARKR